MKIELTQEEIGLIIAEVLWELSQPNYTIEQNNVIIVNKWRQDAN